MNVTAASHRLVAEYLAEFDRRATVLPIERRLVLRESIVEHLTEVVPPHMAERDALRLIREFGSPEEILAQEVDELEVPIAASDRSGRRRSRAWWVIAVIAGVGLVGISIMFGWRLLVPSPAETAPGADPGLGDSCDLRACVVRPEPNGPVRVTADGQSEDVQRTFYEYQAAIDAIEHPLPSGAAWPIGVPANVAGNGSGIVEAGAGQVIADYTWLCASEGAYLDAATAGDEQAMLTARRALESWTGSSTFASLGDTGAGWVERVLTPLDFRDLTGLEADFPNSCAQAGIVNVRNG